MKTSSKSRRVKKLSSKSLDKIGGGVSLNGLALPRGTTTPAVAGPSYGYGAPAYPSNSYLPGFGEPLQLDPSYVQYGQPQYVQPAYVQPTYVQPTYVQPVYSQPVYSQPVYVDPDYYDPRGAVYVVDEDYYRPAVQQNPISSAINAFGSLINAFTRR